MYVHRGKIINVYFESRFINTKGFLPASVASFPENKKKGLQQIKGSMKHAQNVSKQFIKDDKFKVMISKGVHPYQYVNKYYKLDDTNLPPHKEFILVLLIHIVVMEIINVLMMYQINFNLNHYFNDHN